MMPQFTDPETGKKFQTRKHCLLQHIFDRITHNGSWGIGEDHSFYLSDIIQAYEAKRIRPPTSSSNFVLDLCRKSRPSSYRLPADIIALGYDLRKKTGPDVDANKYAGEFVYVGKGYSANSWLV
jgi:hypothetical protein